MFWKRIYLALTLATGWVGSLVAQTHTDYITLNGYQVHPTHILAKLSQPGDGTMAAIHPQAVALLASLGLAIQYEYSLVPGLVIIDNADGIHTSSSLSPAAQAQLLQERLRLLNDSGLFAYATVDTIKHKTDLPTDQRFVDGTLWGLQNQGQNGGKPGADIGAAAAWQITTGTNSVIVAVIDTGIRYTHKDLAENMWHNPGEIPNNGIDDDGNGVVDDVFGFNAITGSGNPFDDESHGSHVSGTIGAAANNGYPHVGVCWHVSLMACKFLTSDGFGANSDAIKCLQYAVRMGAKISNNSWGGGSDVNQDQPLIDAINAAGKKGHLFVAAAGNSGTDDDLIPFSPASFALNNMVVVAALDRKDQLATFSCFGRKTVNLGAPGVEIFSSVATSDTDYDVYEGTSMATPHVAGVAALTLAAHPKASVAELRERVLASAVPIPALVGKTTTGGRVNAYNAVSAEPTGTLKVAVDPANGGTLLLGATNAIFATVTDIFPITNAIVGCTVSDSLGNTNALPFLNDGTGLDAVAKDNIYSAAFFPTNAGMYQFVFAVTASGKTGVNFTNQYIVKGRPDNDAFAHPTKIDGLGGVLMDDNTLATKEADEPAPAGIASFAASLWYAWSPAVDAQTRIDTLQSPFPTVLAVYTGSTLKTLQPVASAAGTNKSNGVQLVFQAHAGTTYRISVASVSTAGKGNFRLNVQPGGVLDVLPPQVSVSGLANGLFVTTNHLSLSGTAVDPQPSPSGVSYVQVSVNKSVSDTAIGTTNWSLPSAISLSPGNNSISVVAADYAGNISAPLVYTVFYRVPTQSNDAFQLATPMSGLQGSVMGDNTGATKEIGEPNHGGNQGGHSVWWVYIPPISGLLRLTTTNSPFDTLMGVYTGDYVDQLTTLAENDDAFPGSGFSALQVAVVAGVPIHIAVDGFSGAQGPISLSYSLVAADLVPVTFTSEAGGVLSMPSGLYPRNTTLAVRALPSPHYQFGGWSGSVVSFDNPLSFTVSADAKVHASFVADRISDDFETGSLTNLSWQTLGNAPWFVQTNDVSSGRYAAQAGPIANSQTTSLVVVTNSSGGEGSFDYKVSSEVGFDFLGFYIDGNQVQQWSGEVDWATYGFALPSGLHTFEWRYSKDATGSAGADTAWLDNVQIHVRPPVDTNSVAKLTLLSINNGSANILVQGQRDQVYLTQISRGLGGWTSYSTNVNTLGSFLLQSAIGTNDVRFYRTIAAP